MEYTTLSLAEIRSSLDAVGADTRAAFGRLDARQLNWRPDAAKWSVAQCFEHLLAANTLMLRSAHGALDGTAPRTLWGRLPLLPGLFGRMLIRSQAPQSTRKFTASPLATPASSDVSADILDRFLAQTREVIDWLRDLDARDAEVIMTSPFVAFITYTVLDGARLMVAHDHRHIQQARRVIESSGFPS